MKYIELVKNAPKRSEGIMWESVQEVSDLVETMEGIHPELAHKFLMKEYGRMYGKHFNESLATETVVEMYHYAEDGTKVEGELVTYDEAKQLLKDVENADAMTWDAYVGANGFAHDLAKSGLSREDILAIAKIFWFEDDDFGCGHKVFWYYSNR